MADKLLHNLLVSCPVCKAEPGYLCHEAGRARLLSHSARQAVYRPGHPEDIPTAASVARKNGFRWPPLLKQVVVTTLSIKGHALPGTDADPRSSAPLLDSDAYYRRLFGRSRP